MALDIKYQKAADLKLADPLKPWSDIAKVIDVSDRQLRRVRESSEWDEYWKSADKDDAISKIRNQAETEANATLWRLYFELTGQLDPQAQEALLHMSDEVFQQEIQYIARYAAKYAN